MVDPASIGAGLLAGGVLKEAAARFDDSNEQMQEALENNDLEEALRIANQDESKLRTLFNGLKETALYQHGDEEAVESDIKELEQYNQEQFGTSIQT